MGKTQPTVALKSMIIVYPLFPFNWVCNRKMGIFVKILLFVRDWGDVSTQRRGAIFGNR